ncbi:hypothetical protein [Acidipropionibacterium thoenii]|uniref:hypothetical protein n=1 Tax=Acidipropionibacterium thoenii TaxID=1751 RepID=UPI0003F739A0|nr:hypothetical protein [Acidipropionibacterium thoenii]
MKTHRSVRALVAAVLLSASLGLGAVPAQAAPISSSPSSATKVTPLGLNSMMCYWLPNYCR